MVLAWRIPIEIESILDVATEHIDNDARLVLSRRPGSTERLDALLSMCRRGILVAHYDEGETHPVLCFDLTVAGRCIIGALAGVIIAL